MPVQCPQCDHPAAPEATAAGACARCGARLDAMPGIELAQLTTLDDRGVHVDGRPPQSFAPPPQALAPPPQSFGPASHAFAHSPQPFAPASQAFAHSPQAMGPPQDAFAPPPEAAGGDDAELGVERSTRAIRIENQWQLERVAKPVAAAAPAPRARGPIAGVVVALGLIAAVAIALVMIASR
jgi:hypothetical protein